MRRIKITAAMKRRAVGNVLAAQPKVVTITPGQRAYILGVSR